MKSEAEPGSYLGQGTWKVAVEDFLAVKLGFVHWTYMSNRNGLIPTTVSLPVTDVALMATTI
jgi:hypothetical protein